MFWMLINVIVARRLDEANHLSKIANFLALRSGECRNIAQPQTSSGISAGSRLNY